MAMLLMLAMGCGMTKQRLFMPLLIKQDIVLELNGQSITKPLSFADGMIGAIPVFDNESDANKWADGAKVIELEFGK